MSLPQAIIAAFAQIDYLDAIAQAVLTDRQRDVWNLMCAGKDSNEIALALAITPKCARELRARAQLRVREAEQVKREGKWRVAVVVQHGSSAMFEDDETARDAIQNADGGLRKAA
jgi:hypothetical protein